MTDREFAALVERLEPRALANPAGYKRRVIALAILGYGYLGLISAVLLVLFALAIASIVFLKALAFKVIIPIGALIWLVAKSMWIRFDPPSGLRVTRDDAPELFSMIENLRHKLSALKVHEVLITDEFGASVAQHPRLGMFGWHRNYLILGLPFMKALTPQQLEAVLAHEFGHLAGGHGKLQGWLYRLRITWIQLLAALQETGSESKFLFRRFFEWYVPYFRAYSFPLARWNEYEADAISAKLTSPETAAAALLRTCEASRQIDSEYWPSITARIASEPAPTSAPYSEMSRFLAADCGRTEDKAWLENALAVSTSYADTHPSLTDRLAALRVDPHSAVIDGKGGADKLLGASLERITLSLDDSWKAAIATAWANRHQSIALDRQALTELNAKRQEGATLSADDELRHALLVEEHGDGPDAAFELLGQLAHAYPDHADTRFILGARRLQRGDEAGIELLSAELGADARRSLAICELIRDHFWVHGDQEKAFDWQERAEPYRQQLAAVEEERTIIRTTDSLEPHGFSDEQLEQVRADLRRIPEVKDVYIVRKRLRYSAEHPLCIVGFTLRRVWWRRIKTEEVIRVRNQIANDVSFPNEALVINIQGTNAEFKSALGGIRGSQVL